MPEELPHKAPPPAHCRPDTEELKETLAQRGYRGFLYPSRSRRRSPELPPEIGVTAQSFASIDSVD
jgi:hypothetical protein